MQVAAILLMGMRPSPTQLRRCISAPSHPPKHHPFHMLLTAALSTQYLKISALGVLGSPSDRGAADTSPQSNSRAKSSRGGSRPPLDAPRHPSPPKKAAKTFDASSGQGGKVAFLELDTSLIPVESRPTSREYLSRTCLRANFQSLGPLVSRYITY